MALDLTGANASISLLIPALFSTPQTLQQFAADNVFEVPQVTPTETLMGVDGVLSGGMIFVPVEQEFMLQANSPSIAIFDNWYLQQIAATTTYPASGTTIMPGLKKMWQMVNGFLVDYKPLPQVQRLAQPQRFRIRWNLSAPQPTA
jgi:hypothetical protein